MVDTLPLALVAVGAFDAVFTTGILREIMQPMTVYPAKDIAVRAIVEVASDEEFGLWRDSTDGVDGLAEAVDGCLTERTAIAFAAITAGQVDHKDMKRIARKDLSAGIKDIAGGTHAFNRSHSNGITPDRGERKGRIE